MGLLDGVGSMVGSWISNVGNRRLSRQAYHQDLKMFNYENEYNKPVNQMARYREAGLNPMLIYGSGQSISAGNTTVSPPKRTPAHMENVMKGLQLPSGVDILNAIINYKTFNKDMEVKDSQIDKNKSEIDKNKVESDLTFAKSLTEDMKRIYLGIQGGHELTNARVASGIADSQIDLFKQKVRKAYLDNALSEWSLNLAPYRMTDQQLKNSIMLYKLEQMFPEQTRNLNVRNELLERKDRIGSKLEPYGFTDQTPPWWKLYSRGVNTVKNIKDQIWDAIINSYDD